MKGRCIGTIGIFLAVALLPGSAALAAQNSDFLPYWANPAPNHTGHIRVVETSEVPRTVAFQHSLRTIPGRREPIGQRIIEVSQNRKKSGPHGSRFEFVAYVPKGSIARGRKLVESGAGAFPCAACHGPTFRGNGAVPALAGRSPSGLVRQLHDFKHGSRGGPAADMMKPEVANMTADMRLDIAAYLASLTP